MTAQDAHDVDACGAAHRRIGSERSDGDQENGGASDGHRIHRLHFKQQAAQEARAGNRAGNAEQGAEKLASSGLNIIAATSLTDAAQQVVKAAEGK